MRASINHSLRRPSRLGSSTWTLSASALVLWSGCAKDPVSPVEFAAPTGARAPSVYDPGARVVTRQLSMNADNPRSGSGPTLESSITLTAPKDGMERASAGANAHHQGELTRVKYAANGADAKDVLRVLIGEHMGRDVLVDASITDKITMDLDEEMTPGDVADVVDALAILHGWSIEDMGDLVAVRAQDEASARLASAPILQTRSAFGGQQTAIRIRKMRFIAPAEVDKALQGLMSDGALVLTAGRTLVLVDTVNQLDKIASVLAALDVPAFEGVQVYTFRLSDRTPEEAQDILATLASGSGLSATGSGNAAAGSLVQFIGVRGTQRLMVLSRDPAAFAAINELIHQVDRPSTDATRQRYIYNIQHYDPNDLKTVVESFLAERIDADVKSADARKMKLTWEPREGLLLIQATPDDYANLLGLLRQIDQPPQQVALRTVIAEIGLTGALEYGVEYFLQVSDIAGSGPLEFIANPGTPALSTGSAFFVGGDGFALIKALDTEGDVSILTQPYFTVLDGGMVKQQVGGEVPFVTADQDSQAQTGGNTAIRREIEYRETGVILTISPKINDLGFVRMKVELEITDVGAESDLGPEFTTRLLTTEVVVPHGRTLVLGGIIDSESRHGISRVPILGSVPFFGVAFQRYSDRDTRTELLLTITPSVINDPYQTSVTTNEFVQAATGVRAALGMHQDLMPGGMLHEGEPQPAPAPLPADPVTEPQPEPTPATPPELPPILQQMMGQPAEGAPAKDAPQ